MGNPAIGPLGAYRYCLGRQWTGKTGEVTFAPFSVSFLTEIPVSAQGLSKTHLMGELAGMVRLPAYQMTLPLSPAACRQQGYASWLPGATS